MDRSHGSHDSGTVEHLMVLGLVAAWMTASVTVTVIKTATSPVRCVTNALTRR